MSIAGIGRGKVWQGAQKNREGFEGGGRIRRFKGIGGKIKSKSKRRKEEQVMEGKGFRGASL